MIHFGTDTSTLLELQRDAGGDVIGLDWRVDLAEAWERLGPGVAVQGNLDPAVLFAPIEEVRRQASAVLERRRRPAGAHLQPRPRDHAAHAGGPRPGPDRPRPRGVEALKDGDRSGVFAGCSPRSRVFEGVGWVESSRPTRLGVAGRDPRGVG